MSAALDRHAAARLAVIDTAGCGSHERCQMLSKLGQLEDYLPLVKFIAERLAIGLPRSVEVGDLISAGAVGLIGAYRNFDPSKGVKFETYASLRVRGSILDELRSMAWVPRSVRARSHEVEKVLARIENELGRQPSEEELVGAMWEVPTGEPGGGVSSSGGRRLAAGG